MSRGWVYLFSADGGNFKIGQSLDPRQRVKGFSSLPFDVKLMHQIAATDLMTAAERLALRTFQGEIAFASDRPCACGKSPKGAPQQIVGEPSFSRHEDSIRLKCSLECQKCHEVHGYVGTVFLSRELADEP